VIRQFDDDSSVSEILTRAVSGDGHAFEQLYLLLHRRLLAYIQVRGSSDAEGLMHDVFLQVFTNLGRFSGDEAQFHAWVFRIARNKLIADSRRPGLRVPEVDIDAALEVWGTDPDQVEQLALSAAGAGSVLDYLRYLTDQQAEVILLRTVGDLSVAEVARVLDKPIGAVKAMQRRALHTLARRLNSEQAVPLGRSSDIRPH
jgi:RNA polymerase sigma factor (sigma-70 family)